ncbi:MAG: invasion associated locus B family protein, partial [Alphaproteobacteria bacterium]
AVQVAIGAKKFDLFTNGDTAWARSTKDDRNLATAMRGGARMVVTGQSSRGTKTKDTYSLSGISAAHKAIGKACGVK